MTALIQYARLETTGLWRAEAGTEAQEVGVSFRDATLILADRAGRPLAHWSLAAVERRRDAEDGAVFAPGPDASESLTLTDPEMIAAIETVRRAIDQSGPRAGRLRLWTRLVAVGVVLAGLAIWLPDALARQALTALPPAAASQIGATLLGHLQSTTGAACRAAPGLAALDVMAGRLLPLGIRQIVILPDGPGHPVMLPGGIVALPAADLRRATAPAALAGLAAAAGQGPDPLPELIETGGLSAALGILTTGTLPDGAYAALAAALLAAPAPVPDDDQLIAAFRALDLPLAPYAALRDPMGESVLGLIEADALLPPDAAPILSAREWEELRAICAG
jgi:phage tail protein X